MPKKRTGTLGGQRSSSCLQALPSRWLLHLINVNSQWGFASISGHLGAHLAGANDQNVDARATQCFIEVDVEAVGASLGCAVDKVGATHAHTCDGAQRHDGAVSLRLEFLAQQDTNGYWCGVVDLCGSHGLFLVLPQFFLVAQGAKSYDGDVYVTALKSLIDDSGVSLKISCIEVDNFDIS